EGGVVTVAPDEPLSIAYSRMRMYDVSQLPVLEGSSVVGIVDEGDLLLAATDNSIDFTRPVREFMSKRLVTVPRHTPVKDLSLIFDSGRVAIVLDDEGFHGLVTRVDVLNYLRRQKQ